jgi:hypothetical protein
MDKAFGTRGVGRGEDVGTSGVARVSQLVMHVEGGVQPEPAVVMLRVVPAKEVFAGRVRAFSDGKQPWRSAPDYRSCLTCTLLRTLPRPTSQWGVDKLTAP